MPMKSLLVLAVSLFAAQGAFAACEPAPPIKQKLSVGESSLRSATFRVMCERLNGDLVDSNDTELKSRLVIPKRVKDPDINLSEDYRGFLRNSSKYRFVVNTIIEPSGQVSWVNVLTASGHPRLDRAVLAFLSKSRYQQPVTFDGNAVRAFHTQTFTFVP